MWDLSKRSNHVEIIGFVFLAWILMSFVERRDFQRQFPPGPCAYCPLGVHLKGTRWVHDNGKVQMPFPNLDGSDGFPVIYHSASPRSLGDLVI